MAVWDDFAQKLERDYATLRTALEPFAKAADRIDETKRELGLSDVPNEQIFVRLADCRAARAAIAKAEGRA